MLLTHKSLMVDWHLCICFSSLPLTGSGDSAALQPSAHSTIDERQAAAASEPAAAAVNNEAIVAAAPEPPAPLENVVSYCTTQWLPIFVAYKQAVTSTAYCTTCLHAAHSLWCLRVAVSSLRLATENWQKLENLQVLQSQAMMLL